MRDNEPIQHAIEFRSNSVLLRATLYEPHVPRFSGKKPVIVMATGDGEKGSQSSTWPILVGALTGKDFPVFLFDFQGLGKSDGQYEDINISTAVQNLRDAVVTASSIDWVDANRIGVLGSSFGGSASLILQGLEHPFRAMGLKSPASFLPQAYENEHGKDAMEEWQKSGTSPVAGYRFTAYTESFRFNIYELSTKMGDCSVLIVHGSADVLVPISQSLRLKYLLGDKLDLEKLEGVDHGYKEPGALEKLAELQGSFFAKHL